MKILNLYPNCSLGGMATVYINRAIQTPDISYNLIFFNNAGGKHRFDAIPNIELRIIEEDQVYDFLRYISSYKKYDIVRVCTWPKGLKEVKNIFPLARLEYEIHSARRRILITELSVIKDVGVDKIICPSEWLKREITHNLPLNISEKVETYPNILTDFSVLDKKSDRFQFRYYHEKIPLLWIGRPHFSVQKNYHDFFQIISCLPTIFFAVMVLSLETDPINIAQMIGIASQYDILDRIVILMNIDLEEMSSLYHQISKMKGIYCSTALYESFGYAVHEAINFNIPVVSYKIGPYEYIDSTNVHLVELGDIFAFKDKIIDLQ